MASVFTTKKVSVKNGILPLKGFLKKLMKTVVRVNDIVTVGYMFTKFFILYELDNGSEIPDLDEQFFIDVLNTVTTGGGGRDPIANDLRTSLKNCYNTHFKALLQKPEMPRSLIQHTLIYEARKMKTMYENNVKMRFSKYIGKFVNVTFKKRIVEERIEAQHMGRKDKERALRVFRSKLKKIKEDLLRGKGKECKSGGLLPDWIESAREWIIPQKESFVNNGVDSVAYDVKVHPGSDYLLCMYKIMKKVEAANEVANNEDKVALLNPFPLRSSVIPAHMTVDTKGLVQMFYVTEKEAKKGGTPPPTKSELSRNITKYKSFIWSKFFRTESKCFTRKGFKFHGMIHTDGVSLSVVFQKVDENGDPIKVTREFKKKKKETYLDEYVEGLGQNEVDDLVHKIIVAIDPNMADLLYCKSGTSFNSKRLRFTQNQRKTEMRTVKYRGIRDEVKDVVTKVGLKVKELEARLSSFSKTTLDLEKFKLYVEKKLEFNKLVAPVYHKCIFRKLRLNSFWNGKKNEQRWMKNFQKEFGKPEAVVVCIGDWSQKENREGFEPVKGKGLRDMFRKFGYKPHLINEYRTSKKCSVCQRVGDEEGCCHKFRKCVNPRRGQCDIVMRHGLVMCNTCARYWNRDENSASNIYILAKAIIEGRDRPVYLRRGNPEQPQPNN